MVKYSMAERTRFGELSEEEIIVQLTRLDSATSISVLSPSKRLRVALEAEKIGFLRVAREEHLHKNVIILAIRDVTAARIVSSGETGNLEDPSVLKKAEELRLIDKELLSMKSMTEKPGIKETLAIIPHVKELLTEYFRFRTIKPLFDQLKMPYVQEHLVSVKRYLAAKTIEDTQNGLTLLSRRYLFAKWLDDESSNIDAKISTAAVFVLTNSCSGLPRCQQQQAGLVRIFLLGIMDAEYKSMGNGKYAQPEDLTLFPNNYSGTIENAAKAYQLYSTANYCPAVLKQFAKWVVDQVPWKERIAKLGFKYYSEKSLSKINYAGIQFLENTLNWSGRKLKWSTLMVDTREVLKEAKRKMLDNQLPET